MSLRATTSATRHSTTKEVDAGTRQSSNAERKVGQVAEDGEQTDKEAATKVEGPPPPPDGGYGWVCTACCFFINAHTWGEHGHCRDTKCW